MAQAYELFPLYDKRASFYGKAVELYHEDNTIELRSYSTIVAKITCHGYESSNLPHATPPTAEVYGWYSQTTGRHIKEFLKQHGFKAENKSQILKDYYVE